MISGKFDFFPNHITPLIYSKKIQKSKFRGQGVLGQKFDKVPKNLEILVLSLVSFPRFLGF